MFVRVIAEATANYSTEIHSTHTEVFRTGTFGIEGDLHKYLEAEKSIDLVDLKCTGCLLKNNCKMCRHTNDPRSVAELEETRLIDSAIQCVSLPGRADKFMFLLDYPELPGVELTQKYLSGQGSNKNVATQSTFVANWSEKVTFLNFTHKFGILLRRANLLR